MRKTWYLGLLAAGITLGIAALVASQNYYSIRAVSLGAPITHEPPVIGNYAFILSSGNVVQNDSAYSYVRLNATSLYPGESFTSLPALNVGFSGVDQNSFTAVMTYRGSNYESNPYWINFSITVPELGVSFATSHQPNSFARSNFTILNSQEIEFFTQVSNVVGVGNEQFEFFFYVGNASTSTPSLTHGPVH